MYGSGAMQTLVTNMLTPAAAEAITERGQSATDFSAPNGSASLFSAPVVLFTGTGFAPFCDRLCQKLARARFIPDRSATAADPSVAANVLFKALLTTTKTTATATATATGHRGQDDCRVPSGLLGPAWIILRASVFRHGTRTALPYLFAAVVFHHVRRTFWPGCPGAGGYLFHQPDEAWRLVLVRPDVFLETTLAAAGSQPGLSFFLQGAQKRSWDLVAGGAAALVITADDAVLFARARLFVATAFVSDAHLRTLIHRIRDAYIVVFLVWFFSCVEYAIARTSHALALWYACYVLATVNHGSGRAVLSRQLNDYPIAAVVFAWSQLAAYTVGGIVPLVQAAVVCAIRQRQPVLLWSLVSIAVTLYALLCYRSRLYIVIEMGGFFLFLGYLGLSGLLMLANEFSSSPGAPVEQDRTEANGKPRAGKNKNDKLI
ncbi:hypothetical protein SPI_07758 [Niveomyces insectorum RCEF 264]|uniref:Uncharacterized protein n=1 Tax=Niveomyces insectorum RCEF 264 TaxID=1081102 RepID=A0A167P0C9_9HYPO|nr:hypothetical protein SPI_07758 [Niveomyces insectorum RCEF 264]